MLQTIFEEGLFHADPHPGNVFVLPDGKLSLLDFGMTGALDEPMRESMVLLLEAVVKGDARGAHEAYLEMAPHQNEKVTRAALLLDIKAVLYEVHGKSAADVSVGGVLDALLRAGSRNGVHNPPEFFLLTRAFVVMESMVHRLAPEHDYMQSFRDEIARLTAQRFSMAHVEERTRKLGRDLERLLSEAPADLRRALRRLAEGDLGRIQAPVAEELGGRVSRSLGRLSSAIAAASLIIGGAMLFRSGGWHHVLGEVMVITGMAGTLFLTIGTLLRYRVRR
jgi:ubiquinone biosynthesis protein